MFSKVVIIVLCLGYKCSNCLCATIVKQCPFNTEAFEPTEDKQNYLFETVRTYFTRDKRRPVASLMHI